MAYEIVISPRALQEIDEAIKFYEGRNTNAPQDFIKVLKFSYNTLRINPYFRKVHRNIRRLPLKVFPYSIYFIVYEKDKRIEILSCFHNRQDPEKAPG